MIIDAHTHISIYDNNANTLEGAFRKLLSDMDKNNVEYAIVIPDNLENLSDIADFNKAKDLIKENKKIFLLGSPQIIQRGDSEVKKYEDLLRSGEIKGIKFFPGHDPYYPTDFRCDPYYQIANKYNAPVVFHTGINPGKLEVAKYNDPINIIKVAKKYPNLKVVITHYFWPKMEYCYRLTKDIPNIYFELAGVGDPEVIEASGGIEKIKSILNQTILDRPRQVIFGTDWPMCKIEDHIEMVKSLKLPKETEQNIFFNNAVEVYNLHI
jgi:predicted TIM-barrel fold metal-dependent hydrolase